MVTNDDIFLAILAMDVYHTGKNTPPVGGKDAVGPGYLHNLKGVDETKGIGVATRINQFAHGTYGFFAASYAWNGKTVISYRGTDQSFSSGPDVDHGYSVSVGSPYGGQAQQAIDFYVRTAGRTPNNSNVIVTGQSLGGGLAGLIGRIYRADTVMFNNMNFELAAHNAHDYSVGTVVYTGGEPTYLEDPALKQKI